MNPSHEPTPLPRDVSPENAHPNEATYHPSGMWGQRVLLLDLKRRGDDSERRFRDLLKAAVRSQLRGWWPLPMLLLVWLLSVIVANGQNRVTANLPTLTHIEQIRRMTFEEAGRGYPVRLRAVVTYYNWRADDLFIQDSTAGIWVNPGQTRFALHHGEFVEVEGFSGVGDLAPEIEHPHFRSLGEAPLPNPRRPTSDELASGRLDSQWIELEAVVRSVAERDGGLVLNVSSGAFECRVFVLKYPSVPTDIVDSQVRLRGVFAGLYDPSSVRVIGFQVLTPSWSDVKVLQRPRQALWSEPVRPIRWLLRLTPEDAFTHRVRVHGVVTYQQLGRFLCIRDSGGALLVNSTQPTSLKVGDLIDAVGYPALGDYTVIMRDAILQRIGGGPAPDPVVVSPEELRAGRHDADLVRLSARLLNCTTRTGKKVLELQADGVTFRATLYTGTNSSPLGSLRVGCLLQLTGVSIVEVDDNNQANGFEILLRSPADVVVLKLPSWWTVGRIAWLLIILAGMVFSISLWVAVLRRRVQERTETIRATLESTADGILVVSSACKIVAYNHKFVEMWRIPEPVRASRDNNVLLNFILSQLKDPDAFLTRVRQTYADCDAQTDDVVEFKDGRVFEHHSEPQRAWGRNIGRVWGFRDITERKQVEKVLRESEAELREALLAAQMGVWRWSPEADTITWSEELYRIAGRDPKLPAPSFKEHTQAFTLESWERLKTAVECTLATGTPNALDLELVRPDGSKRWVTGRGAALRDASGHITQLRGTVQDITERKQAEEMLAEYEKAVEGSQDMIAVVDREYRYRIANQAFLNQRGLEKGEVVGHLVADVLGREVFSRAVKNKLDECFQGKIVQYEIKHRYSHLGERDLSVTYFPIEGAAGVDRAVGVLRDITDRKRAEEALRESETRFRAVFENAAIGIALVDMHGHPVETNPAVQRMLGYSAPELAQMAFTEFTHPEDTQASGDLFASLCQGQRDRYQLDKRYRRKDGQIVWGQLTQSLVRTQNGEPQYAIAMVEDISERKRAEEALGQAAKRFKLVTLATHDAVFDWDLVSHEIWRNETYQRLFGAPERCVDSGNWWLNRLHPEDRERVLAAQDAALGSGGSLFSSEFRLRRPDGSYADIVERSHIVRDAQGQAVRMIGALTDISERKRAEEALRESEERLRSLVENATVGIYRTTPDGRILMANPALVKMLGYDSFEELAGRDLEKEGFEPNYPRSEFKARLEREGEISGLEEAWVRRDGTTIFVRESARAKRGSNGDVLYYDGIVENVTEHRRAEESRRYLASIVESSDDAIFGTSCEGAIQSWNRGAEKLYGYAAAEMIGQPVSLLASQDQLGEIARLRDRVNCSDDVQRYETVQVRKDGSQVDVSISLSTIKDSCGRVIGASVVAHDITERKRAQQGLERSLEELRALAVRLQNAREEERKRLAREIHDQLGQALTAIKIALFTWVSQTGGDPQHPPQETSDLLQLVDQTIKRVRRIATELRPGILDDLGLVAAIEWAGEDFEARTGIKCRLDLPQENIAIHPERATAIFRILQESLTNVVRHAAASEVKIRLEEKDKELTLLVQDDGKGMSMDKLFRTKSLGILGMHERALVFGGEVVIEATPGKGTTVLVRIPQADLT